ncbi:MAG: hypothetical protein JNN05_08450 [Candidatus Omnitrophica bacterium]|nr:hypothetical protein [Candidatus Omnitrophota bacterium]
MTINTHNLIIEFGKHKGERWTRVPVSYLKWLINQPNDEKFGTKNKEIAQAELERRGTTTPDRLEISGHAIDSASLRVRQIWHKTKNENEGLYSWLYRIGSEAVLIANGQESVKHLGIKWVFVYGEIYPTLKTVTKD